MNRKQDKVWSESELRLMFCAVMNCSGEADLLKVCRAVCEAFGRQPQFAAGARPSVPKQSEACLKIVSRRIWKCLTAYGNERPPIHELYGRDYMSLSWGDKWIIRKYQKAQKVCSLLDLKQYLCRRPDSRTIEAYLTSLSDPALRRIKEPEGHVPGLVRPGREHHLTTVLNKLAYGLPDTKLSEKFTHLQLLIQGVGDGH